MIKCHSKFVFVKLGCKHFELGVSLFPNPVESELNVALSKLTEDKETILLEVFDAEGRLVRSKVKQLTSKVQLFTLKTNKLSGGVYFLKIRSLDDEWTSRSILFVKLE